MSIKKTKRKYYYCEYDATRQNKRNQKTKTHVLIVTRKILRHIYLSIKTGTARNYTGLVLSILFNSH